MSKDWLSYGGGSTEASALLAVIDGNRDAAAKILGDSWSNELKQLRDAADELSDLCQELINSGQKGSD